jgi:hypothetical protein
MAKTQFKFAATIEIQMPKVEGKADTKKMQMAIKTALSKGAQKGATYIQKSLGTALDQSITQFGAIDTGRLKKSLEIRPKFGQTKVGFSIIYKTPYAAFVHYGGVMRPYGNPNAATVTIPGRPWIDVAVKGFDLKTPFDKGIGEAWSAQFGT